MPRFSYAGHRPPCIALPTGGDDGIDAVGPEWLDIAILDLDLPSIAGFDVLEQIFLFSDAPLIGLTSSNDEADEAWAVELRAGSCITKPLSHIEFLARMEGLLRHAHMGQLKEECPMQTWQRTWRTNLINPLFSYSVN
jgi:DNA-binding response OmpR family regulator